MGHFGDELLIVFTTKAYLILANAKRWFMSEMGKYKLEAPFLDILPLTKHYIDTVLKMDIKVEEEDHEQATDGMLESHAELYRQRKALAPFHQHKWFYGGEKRCGCNEAPLAVCSCGATRCVSCLPMETTVPWLWDVW